MRAILIDPVDRSIKEVELGDDYREIQRKLSYTDEYVTFTPLELNERNVMYLDDEGLLKAGLRVFQWKGYMSPLAGRGLILGQDSEGDSVSTTMTVESIKRKVFFVPGTFTTGEFGPSPEPGVVNHPLFGEMTVIGAPKPILGREE